MDDSVTMSRPSTPTIAASAAPAEPGWNLSATLGLVLLVLAAAAIRVAFARGAHLWFDELDTLFVARLPVPALLRAVAADIHPPLHFLLVSLWRAVGGEGDLWIKSLSILFGVAGVTLLVPAGRDFVSRPAGWLAAALVALHAEHAAFSQESRSFALLFLLVALATWLAWRWIARARLAEGALYVLVGAAALWTHYLAGVVLAFVAAWGVVALRRTPSRIGGWLALHAAIALAFAPQVPTLLEQLARLKADHWVKDASVSTLVNFVRQLCLGPMYLVPVLLAAATLPLLRPAQRRAASLLWCASLLPVGVLWALAMAHRALFLERYMFFALPSFAILVAAGVLGLPGRWTPRIAAAVLLAFAARGLAAHQPQAEAVALDRAVRSLAAHVEPGDVVVHSDAHSVLYARHYPGDRAEHVLLLLTPALPYYEGQEVIPAAWRIGPAAFDSLRASGRRWWGFHERYGYAGAEPATDLVRRAALGDSLRIDRVTLWAGTAAQSLR